MGAMALLPFAVTLLVPIARFRAAFAGRVRPDDFKLGESAAVPASVLLPNRKYMNLLELPTLFLPVCRMFFVARRVTASSSTSTGPSSRREHCTARCTSPKTT
jgi:hypothetical protein